MKTQLILGALVAGLGVGIGAFGAHGLREMLAQRGYADTFETAVRYQMYHALAILLLPALQGFVAQSHLRLVAILFLIGVVIFSGSLYVLTLSGVRWLGAVTPIGGLCFLAGWAWLGYGLWKGI